MLLSYLYKKATADLIKFDVKPSKCINFRFSESNCNECIKVCNNYAIDLDNNLVVDSDKCTNCLLCASVCKTESLDAKIAVDNLYTLSNKQKQILIGCTRTVSVHNYRKSCIGWLSEEYLLFLVSLFPEGVNLDLTSCDKCENNKIYQTVKTRVTKLANENILGENFPVKYIVDSNDLPQHSNKVSRRDFFTGISKTIKNEASNYISEDTPVKFNYGDTSLPNRQNVVSYLLNSESKCKDYATNNFVYSVSRNNNCDYCEECSAVCPTDALTIDEKNKTFEFAVDKCVGCGLCEMFCDSSGLEFCKSIDTKIRYQDLASFKLRVAGYKNKDIMA